MTILLQEHFATAPTLSAVARVAELRALAASSHSPEERDTATAMADRPMAIMFNHAFASTFPGGVTWRGV